MYLTTAAGERSSAPPFLPSRVHSTPNHGSYNNILLSILRRPLLVFVVGSEGEGWNKQTLYGIERVYYLSDAIKNLKKRKKIITLFTKSTLCAVFFLLTIVRISPYNIILHLYSGNHIIPRVYLAVPNAIII